MQTFKRLLLGLAIVLAVTAIGAAIPFAYRDRTERFFGGSALCDVLATGIKVGHLNSQTRIALIDVVVASAQIDPKSKSFAEYAKNDCPKTGDVR